MTNGNGTAAPGTENPSTLVLPERMAPLPPRALPATDASPLALLQVAVQRGDSIETLKELKNLALEMQAFQAKQAFNVAFASFKAEAVKIVKGTKVLAGPLEGKYYANLSDIVEAVTPALSKHGLAISWKLTKDEKDWMEVTCTLRHADGHSESVSMGGAPDVGAGRNAIQARGSTKTYLEKYTATGILGLAAADDDGAGGPTAPTTYLSREQQATVQTMCEEISKTMLVNLKKSLNVERLEQIPASEFDSIVRRLKATKAEKDGGKK